MSFNPTIKPPYPVRVVDKVGSEIWNYTQDISLTHTLIGGISSPKGKHLIIQYIGGRVTMTSGVPFLIDLVTGKMSNQTYWSDYTLLPIKSFSFESAGKQVDEYLIGQNVWIALNPNEDLVIRFLHRGTGTISSSDGRATIHFCGYYLPIK